MVWAGLIIFQFLMLQLVSENLAQLHWAGTIFNKASVELKCQSDGLKPIDECYFHVGSRTIKTFDGLKNENYEFIGNGLSKGECGLSLLKVNKANQAKATCSLVFGKLTQQPTASENLVVLSSSANDRFKYRLNEMMEFNCTAGANVGPAPKISLYIDGNLEKTTSTERVLHLSKRAEFIIQPGYNGFRGAGNRRSQEQEVQCKVEDGNSAQFVVREVLVSEITKRVGNRWETIKVPVVVGSQANIVVRNLANEASSSKHVLTVDGIKLLESQIAQGTVKEYHWGNFTVSDDTTNSAWVLEINTDYSRYELTVIIIPVKIEASISGTGAPHTAGGGVARNTTTEAKTIINVSPILPYIPKDDEF